MVITLSMWPPRRRPNKTGSRTVPPPFLDDSQWKLIADLFPHPPITAKGGRPRVGWHAQSGAKRRDGRGDFMVDSHSSTRGNVLSI